MCNIKLVYIVCENCMIPHFFTYKYNTIKNTKKSIVLKFFKKRDHSRYIIVLIEKVFAVLFGSKTSIWRYSQLLDLK